LNPFRHGKTSHDESVSPRTCFPCSAEHRNPLNSSVQTFPCPFIFLERKMPKQLINLAAKSPFALLAVCFALWFAAHSFFAGLFVFFVAAFWIKKSISSALKSDLASNEVKPQPAPAAAAPISAFEANPQTAAPIKRQYAKSAVVVQFKTGTDN
jgi:hypothetical protein